MNHDAYHNSEQSEAPNEPTESCAFDHERNSLVVARGAGCIPVLDGAALMDGLLRECLRRKSLAP